MRIFELSLSRAAAICLVAPLAAAQANLSANSGINPQDTYAIMDMTVQTTGTVVSPTPTSNVAVRPVAQTFHLEIGYDFNGSPIINFFPQATGQNPVTADVSTTSAIRYAGGQITAFDASGNPISVASPNASIPTGWPLNLPGLTSGSSVIAGLVVPDIAAWAAAQSASYTMSGSTAQATRTISPGANITWQYAQSAYGWTLQSINWSIQASSGTTTRSMQLANLVYSDNASNDANRQAISLPGAQSAAQRNTVAVPNAGILHPFLPNNAGTYSVQNLGGPQNVLFQHGFLSSGSTWGRMTGWLNQDFLFGNEVVTSLAATAPLASQGQNLETILQAVGGNQYILIGHSQGGLISRYAAQGLQSAPATSNYVKGVLTVDTPHLGADLTLTAPAAIASGVESLAQDIFGTFGCLTPYDNYGCYIADLMYVGIDALAQSLVDSVGALNDLTPGSTFLTQLNGNQENFLKAAVIGETPQRWLLSRVVDNFVAGSPNPEDVAGERNAATITEIVYDAVLLDLTVSTIEEIEWFDYCYFEGGLDDGDPYCDSDPYAYEIAADGVILADMDKVDAFYDKLIAPNGDGSDGFVQNTSQFYPSSTAVQYAIPGGDSHTSAVRSPYDHTALDSLLAQTFQVPIQASCSFSTPTPSISVPATGGTYSFSVNASSNGCQWSATPQSTWLSVGSSSVSGNGSEPVTFSVQPLTAMTPRLGTLQVGNGFNSFSVSVLEGPTPCSYNLSPGPQITFYPGGGSTTIQVATQTGCVWSAASNQSWVTFQNGNGTGSGTFTIVVAQEPPGSTATVTVMGQVLQVLVIPQTITCGLCGNPRPIRF